MFVISINIANTLQIKQVFYKKKEKKVAFLS